MTKAIIHFYAWDESLSPFTMIAGVNILKKAIITGSRAGIETFFLFSEKIEKLEKQLSKDKRTKGLYKWIAKPELINEDKNTLITVYSAQTIAMPDTIKSIMEEEKEVQLIQNNEKTGIAKITLQSFIEHSSKKETLATFLETLPSKEVTSFVHKVKKPIREVENAFLKVLQSPLEGTVDVYFNRPLGRIITIPLARIGINPNFVSILSIIMGLATAYLILYGKYVESIVGVLFLQIAAILDCMDGDLARLQHKESKLGKWLDLTGDNVVHLAIFIALGFREYWLQKSFTPVILGAMLAFGAIVSFLLVVYSQVSLKPRSVGKQTKSLEKLLAFIDKMTSRDFTVLLLVGAIMNDLSWFLWLSAVGTQIFWIMLLFWILSMRRKLQNESH